MVSSVHFEVAATRCAVRRGDAELPIINRRSPAKLRAAVQSYWRYSRVSHTDNADPTQHIRHGSCHTQPVSQINIWLDNVDAVHGNLYRHNRLGAWLYADLLLAPHWDIARSDILRPYLKIKRLSPQSAISPQKNR
ncbi:hypothetical protein MTO96_040651 [Rhipicephalus appendiculatus]